MRCRILLQEHTRIRRRNRKIAEQDIDPRLLAKLAMLNLNLHILTRGI